MVDRSRTETGDLTASEQEAYFFAKHYLKPYSPTHDDLMAGIVDGSGDGGIDGMYLFVNGVCVRDDLPPKGMGFGAGIQLVMFQTKNTRSFSEGSVDKLIVHLPELLALDRDERQLSTRFNPKIIEITRRFLQVVQALEMPTLAIYVGFASLQAEGPHHPNVASKGSALHKALQRCFASSDAEVSFFDAAAVMELARYRPPSTKTLLLAENPISTDTAGGYIGVASLDQYNRFITDANGHLDSTMFDANVRDYESESGVNRSIQATLESDDEEMDFWWLNNGVTVVADKVQLAGKQLSLASPQVVNGLQTSHEIFKRGSRASLDNRRSVLVKVIEADRENTKDSIIKATNSQTTLGTATLRATDKVQRNIEEYLATIGLAYERRKNYYRNQQIPLAELVSIDQMGQAITSSLAQFPHIARGEVSKIFDDDIYHLVFHDSHPLAAYGQAITILRSSESFLRHDQNTRGEVENFAFHLSTAAAIALTRKVRPTAAELAAVDQVPTRDLLASVLPVVRQAFNEVVNKKDLVMLDQVAKDPLSTSRLLNGMRDYLKRPQRSNP